MAINKIKKEVSSLMSHEWIPAVDIMVRSFTLPSDVDETKIRAEHKDGVLNVFLPKTTKTKSETIEVKISE